MLAQATTFTIEALQARRVTVEVDVRPGLPAFNIVGLADASVREARERVQAAILNCGFQFPGRRVTVNLAPGDLPKVGPGLDLALACGVLAASGQLQRETLSGCALFGELGLDGVLKPCLGTLTVAHACRQLRIERLVLACEGSREAMLVRGLLVAPARTLASAVAILRGHPADDPAPAPPAPARFVAPAAAEHTGRLDLSDVRGQAHAARAVVIAAAGAHNCLLSGPPGVGKTMLAQRVPSILPPLSHSEAIEVTRIHALAGDHPGGLARERPFRAPHHSTTAAGLVGGAHRHSIGEVVLAHRGVLFLDELSEFARGALEALRQPLEDGRVAIVRARRAAVYPARFMLIAATNPCPCGYAGDRERCACSEPQMARHRRRLSGPLLDRIDLRVQMDGEGALGLAGTPAPSSRQAREEVMAARERQRMRLREEGARVNAEMDAGMLARHARLDEHAEAMLGQARARWAMSARAEHRTLRVARTIADLAGRERIHTEDVGAALALRPQADTPHSRAA
ncbi:MAG TPA: YifB family Mg chelatase-like AAA ATPase [Solirubrobacteraceae bacterium]|nr:YifB family Mg chelatase-like AAA ATPase [Solirubrobacteraceae bacterium]